MGFTGKLNTARWGHLRRFILERDGYRCQCRGCPLHPREACGKAGRLEIDHVKPLHRGGAPWTLDNLQALCRGCHIVKTSSERKAPPVDPERQAWRDRLAAAEAPGQNRKPANLAHVAKV